LILTLSGWSAHSAPPLLPKKKEKTEVIQLVENGDGERVASAEEKDSAKAFNPVDPLPQALLLTAIVISFGVTGFLIVLVSRGVETTGTMEFGELPKQEGEL
jgi:multisubunit Na+/H+ antiporter MnhC subunit